MTPGMKLRQQSQFCPVHLQETRGTCTSVCKMQCRTYANLDALHFSRKALMTELTKRGIFGKINAFVCSIEWQKRGLPHAHILLWLAKEDEIRADSIDAIVSAEIPDKETNPHLHDVVIANTVHGPCGKMNPNCPCMKDGLCTEHYPKDFVPETMCSEDGYPLYRRRRPDDGGQTAKKTIRGNEVEVDNRWVVPYSPYLCHMFKCHINVEVCNSIKAIKYVIKYVNKGNDMAIFALQRNNPNDEIDVYQAARYVSCSEACWRLFEFSIHDRYPTVMNLQIHLPNGQCVLFTEENAATLAKDPPKTTLTAYFDLCSRYANDKNAAKSSDRKFVLSLPYAKVPEYFTFDSQSKTWRPRLRGKSVCNEDDELTIFRKADAIGRVYTIHPKQEECFYVRLLLHNKTGCCSFEDLRTVNQITHPTFREACKALGLLEDAAHWAHTMEEAALYASASSLRTLFAIFLTSCQVGSPQELWETHKDSMTEDILRHCRDVSAQPQLTFTGRMYNEALTAIEYIVHQISSHNLHHFGFQPIQREGTSITYKTIIDFLNLKLFLQIPIYLAMTSLEKHLTILLNCNNT